MHSTGLLGAAVANNASWCDAVCRAHGHRGTFSSRLWTSTAHRLRLYPHAITLHPETAAPEVLAAAAAARPFAVKDSFARLDLALAGFRLLAEASWIARDGAPAEPDGGLSWDTVTSPGELCGWEAAWAAGGRGDGPVFRPGLLADPRCTVLACREQDAIIAGAVVYAAEGAAGISNVFSTGLPLDRLWGSIQSAVARLHPHLPAVGYEEGASLEAARRTGFHALGSLRIWIRPSLPSSGQRLSAQHRFPQETTTKTFAERPVTARGRWAGPRCRRLRRGSQRL